jgi:outer membrane protein TolC
MAVQVKPKAKTISSSIGSFAMNEKKIPIIVFCLLIISFFSIPRLLIANESETSLFLKTVIRIALDANLGIENSRQETAAALAKRNESRTYFYPTFNATYQYQRNEEEITSPLGNLFIPPKKIIVTPEETYTFVASVTQPLFTGFSVLNQYKMTELGLDLAKTNEKLIRQDVILQATKAYYLILKAEKFVNVTKETVTQISAQKDVVNNFYKVGMSPLNDLLETEVLLANAKQNVVRALNDLESAKSQMNVILRRPMDQPIGVVDILSYDPFAYDLNYCLTQADENRLEIQIIEMEIALAEKDIELRKKDYYPTISLQGSYYKFGTEWDVNGGDGISDDSTWNIKAVASWDFWQWGRSSYGVHEKKSRLSQALLKKSQLQDEIHFKVKKAFLDMKAAEKNIQTVETAIEQAKENYRINEERYQEQVATSTDVLTAQTLLTATMTNYYTALYDFKIAKASLFREMGQEVVE